MSYDDDAESAPDLVFDRPTLRPPRESGGMWELVNDWSLFYMGEIYHIAAGFKTDGASIPRFLWRVCGTPLDVPRIYAAIVHDWLYSGGDIKASRADADALYRDLQIALGVSRFKACIEWVALRLCGGSHWYENTNKKEGTKMNRLIMFAAVALISGLVMADIYRDGPVRDIALPEIKVVMIQGEDHTWRISEDAPLFAARFADVYFADSLLNYAEQRELAKGVAKAVAAFFGSTNAVRVAHWERPKPASTNMVDVLISNLNAKLVTDEIVPNEFHAQCMDETQTRNKKEGTK